jgi:3-oxoacyl-[acyl-carrier-protein] synthase-3
VLGCDAEARQTLRVRGFGCGYAGLGVTLGDTLWDFDGPQIFKRAVKAMSHASGEVLETAGVRADEVDLVVPHQANLRIIESVAKHAGIPMERVVVTVERYGNMSAATVPVALVEALDQGRVSPGSYLLMPAFGGGLTYCSLLVRWGDRVTPLATCDEELPPPTETALEMVNRIRAGQDPHGRSRSGLLAPVFPEA